MVFIALLFFTAGGYFTNIFARQLIGVAEARGWEKQNATIERSKAVDSVHGTRHWELLYSYERGGREYAGTRYSFMPRGGLGSGHVQTLARRFSPGATTTFWVDPEQPSRSVLVQSYQFPRDSAALGVTVLFAVAIVLALGLVRLWLRRRNRLV